MTGSILRLASLLAPADVRAEWLAEWRGELAYIERFHRERMLRFSLGAFHDAVWLRRHAMRDPGALLTLDSPLRCLALLCVLAAASIVFGSRSPVLHDFAPVAYSDPSTLALVSHRANVSAGRHYPEIPLAEFRQSSTRLPHAAEAAFYVPRKLWLQSRYSMVAFASPNLFGLLGVPVPRHGLILTRTSWRRCFHSDPQIVGRTIDLDGVPATISAVLPDATWMLPGIVDAWLLDDGRLDGLPQLTRGYMLARLDGRAALRVTWRSATPDELGEFGQLAFAQVPHTSAMVFDIIFFIGLPFLLFPVFNSGGLGAYPASRHAPSWAIRVRRWLFLGAKIALLFPIVLFGAFALGVAHTYPA